MVMGVEVMPKGIGSGVSPHHILTDFCYTGSSKRVIDEEELLTSTWEMRGITFGTMLLIGLLMGKGISEVSGPGEALAGVAAFGFAYYLSGDPGCYFGSGQGVCLLSWWMRSVYRFLHM